MIANEIFKIYGHPWNNNPLGNRQLAAGTPDLQKMCNYRLITRRVSDQPTKLTLMPLLLAKQAPSDGLFDVTEFSLHFRASSSERIFSVTLDTIIRFSSLFSMTRRPKAATVNTVKSLKDFCVQEIATDLDNFTKWTCLGRWIVSSSSGNKLIKITRATDLKMNSLCYLIEI